ncbi:Anaphase-promoting complex (APC), Cdc16 subunit [Plasmopara halstedii]|uniref:Anaphase-promoting complex (APC), Cdc16 subunit n=1 Tax=Plasmopara halstedii TaxID=4781 RepID=A0A0P1AR36_PLAHL|nr:Anaphase-promoting complex (APC), Cdc16 subunit [Plasmopara halstedii]CEG43769.1 Anaphase-promoting complex (APC), Cdc16 subunit [Plasmopara halstedii]|eukprot:XP_024580138.1 Anaphase-promoting complex (APC), Cdc16 subunit [Plasmopara halstedii]
MVPPPPTPCQPSVPSIRGSSWCQPSPVQTPDCTTRTLAFDSVASSKADEVSARNKKRRRRVGESAVFTSARRPLGTEQEEDQDENDEIKDTEQMWTYKSEGDDLRPATSLKEQVDTIQQPTKPPLRKHKTVASVQKHAKMDRRQMTVDRLRHLVKACSAQHHVVSALFYADKLVTMSPKDGNDVLLYANACYLNHQFHRAIHAIKKAKLAEIKGFKENLEVPKYMMLRACLLLGKCMLAIKQKEECLEVLGTVLPEREQEVVLLAKKVNLGNESDDNADGINVVSSLALLMGETYEAFGNRENATLYYRIALRCDVHCSEAFFHLFDKYMLSTSEEKELMTSLDFSADEMQLLELLYQPHVGKYDTMQSVAERFAEVEDNFGLKNNLELKVTRAETFYYQHDIQQAYEICESIRKQDPFNFRVVTVYVGTLVELGKSRELYQYAHQLVDVYSTKASAWYTVGCYYLLIKKFEAAQRYFHKATSLEPSYAPAWIGFGNSFAAQDESDQAMSSYRTASSLFPGSHLPPLYIGMEYLRTNNLIQAQNFIRQASTICPNDPLIYNELGSIYYKQKDYLKAIELFLKALQLCNGLPERLMEAWEPTLYNLGYSYRKLRKFDSAIYYFDSALRLSPQNASVLAALGFTYHMKGNTEQAIEYYHAALAFSPEDTLAGSMITVAFEESLSCGPGSFPELTAPPSKNAPKTSGLTPLRARRVAGNDSKTHIRGLNQSYSSIERSRLSLACSSLDFSDDSSMMNVDEE